MAPFGSHHPRRPAAPSPVVEQGQQADERPCRFCGGHGHGGPNAYCADEPKEPAEQLAQR